MHYCLIEAALMRVKGAKGFAAADDSEGKNGRASDDNNPRDKPCAAMVADEVGENDTAFDGDREGNGLPKTLADRLGCCRTVRRSVPTSSAFSAFQIVSTLASLLLRVVSASNHGCSIPVGGK